MTLPSGNTVTDTCTCDKTAYMYHPQENVLYEMSDRNRNFRVWYKKRGSKEEEYFIADAFTVDPSKIIDHNKNFEEIEKSRLKCFFVSFEECQEFCDYLNKKMRYAGYDYNREGKLIAERTGEDNADITN